jgi:putative oxidoreductase
MLTRVLGSRTEEAYALLRIVSGLMFLFHGLQKILHVYTDTVPPVGSQLWIGGLIELVGGSLIALGAFAPYAAFLASGTMAVAYVQYHWRLQLDRELLPRLNGGELALLYSFLFLFVACRGSGIWSIDYWKSTSSMSKTSVPEGAPGREGLSP